MKKSRMQIVLLGLVVLALAAGVMAGMLASRLPGTGQGGEQVEKSPLEEELGLSAEQSERMRQIWEGVRGRVQGYFRDAQDLQRQRDDAVVKMLSEEQRARFEKISKEYADRYTDLESKRTGAFNEAVEATKKLLNDEQRKKYEEIVKSRVGKGPTTMPAFAR